MKHHPLILRTEQVQAILDGRKTQDRKLIKYPLKCPTHHISIGESYSGPILEWSPYQPGDLLYVKETWQETTWLHQMDENYGYIYQASENGKDWEANDEEFVWKSPAIMPKSAARIWLEITNVRTERLQDITEEDAIKEGVKAIKVFNINKESYEIRYRDYKRKDSHHPKSRYYNSPVASFKSLWQSIHSPESWQKNDWVWVREFKVLSTTGKNF